MLIFSKSNGSNEYEHISRIYLKIETGLNPLRFSSIYSLIWLFVCSSNSVTKFHDFAQGGWSLFHISNGSNVCE